MSESRYITEQGVLINTDSVWVGSCGRWRREFDTRTRRETKSCSHSTWSAWPWAWQTDDSTSPSLCFLLLSGLFRLVLNPLNSDFFCRNEQSLISSNSKRKSVCYCSFDIILRYSEDYNCFSGGQFLPICSDPKKIKVVAGILTTMISKFNERYISVVEYFLFSPIVAEIAKWVMSDHWTTVPEYPEPHGKYSFERLTIDWECGESRFYRMIISIEKGNNCSCRFSKGLEWLRWTNSKNMQCRHLQAILRLFCWSTKPVSHSWPPVCELLWGFVPSCNILWWRDIFFWLANIPWNKLESWTETDRYSRHSCIKKNAFALTRNDFFCVIKISLDGMWSFFLSMTSTRMHRTDNRITR